MGSLFRGYGVHLEPNDVEAAVRFLTGGRSAYDEGYERAIGAFALADLVKEQEGSYVAAMGLVDGASTRTLRHALLSAASIVKPTGVDSSDAHGYLLALRDVSRHVADRLARDVPVTPDIARKLGVEEGRTEGRNWLAQQDLDDGTASDALKAAARGFVARERAAAEKGEG